MAQRCGCFTCVTYAKIPSCVMGAKLSCGGSFLLRQKCDVSAHLRISNLVVLYLDSIALPTNFHASRRSIFSVRSIRLLARFLITEFFFTAAWILH